MFVGFSQHRRGCPPVALSVPNVSDILTYIVRLSFSSVELSVSITILRVQWLFLGLAHGRVGRVARTNVFEVVFGVRFSLRSSC